MGTDGRHSAWGLKHIVHMQVFRIVSHTLIIGMKIPQPKIWRCGAMVARKIPVLKVACSIVSLYFRHDPKIH